MYHQLFFVFTHIESSSLNKFLNNLKHRIFKIIALICMFGIDGIVKKCLETRRLRNIFF